MLNYKEILFRSNSNSRFIVSLDNPQNGWNSVKELPRTVKIETLSVLNPNDKFSITEVNYKDYSSSITPDLPSAVKITQDKETKEAILLSKTSESIIVLWNNKLLEVSKPYTIEYDKCSNANCELIYSGVDILLSENVNSRVVNKNLDMTFEAGGLSWEAYYKIFIDFDNSKIEELSADIVCKNNTGLDYLEIVGRFMAEPERYRTRSLSMAAMSSMPENVNSTQTNTGSAIYTLKNKISIPKESTCRYNLIRLINIPTEIKLEYNILSQKQHPETIIKFNIPKELTDGIPAGDVEFWDNKTWLSTNHIPMAGPNDEILLSLGQNAFVRTRTSVLTKRLKDKIIKDENGMEREIMRTAYFVKVDISNYSVRPISIIAYHPLDGIIENYRSKLTSNVRKDSDGNERLEFSFKDILPNSSANFEYELVN